MPQRKRHIRFSVVFRNPFARLRLALLIGLLLLAGGTVGYVKIEQYSFLDALYMTVITLSTVGYTEVRPLDAPGKIFTIGLIMTGIGTAAWAFATAAEALLSVESLKILAKKRMERIVGKLTDHYIVCGFGRIGQQIAEEYGRNNVRFVVIDRDESRLEMLRDRDIPHVVGDAADDDVLRSAGIDRALALIAVTPTDAINTFIVLSARSLSAKLYIVARADAVNNEGKLYRAGASKVVSPHALGGRWMGITAINPAVTDFITAMTEADHMQFALREFTVTHDSDYCGKTFGAADLRGRTGALVVAVKPGGDVKAFHPNPPDTMRLHTGDILIAVGSIPQLTHLARLTQPGETPTMVPLGIDL